jgi:hypothetical protein
MSMPDWEPTPVHKNLRSRLSWQWHIVVLLAAITAVILRRPDAILNAQFFVEDGRIWYADAFNHGWLAVLFEPYAGYQNVVPRLVGGLALLVPLSAAPLLMSLFALVIQVSPVSLLLSSRLAGMGTIRFRGALAIIYLALPNCWESHVSLAFVQWYLAVLACLLIVASVPVTRAGRILDALFYLLCGLTGPFSILLTPIAAWVSWKRRERWRWIPLCIFAATGAIQVVTLLCVGRSGQLPLGATLELFARILSGQIYLGTLLGVNMLSMDMPPGWLLFVFASGALLVGTCLFKAGLEIRAFLTFGGMVFAASLMSPAIAPGTPGTAWHLLATTPGCHYWLLPTLAFAWAVGWYGLAPKRGQLRQIIGVGLLLLMVTGVVRDFRHPTRPDLRFKDYVARFQVNRS